MKWLLRLIPSFAALESENLRLRAQLDFERKVTRNQQKLLEQLTTHRDLLLSSRDYANRELTKLRARRNGEKGEQS